MSLNTPSPSALEEAPFPCVHWIEAEQNQSARWRSESAAPPPKRVVLADDRMSADTAYRLACEGTGLLWRGDYQNARHLVQALARRNDRKTRKNSATPAEAFNLHRQAQAQRARVLASVLIPLNADHTIPLRRAPDAQQACVEAYGLGSEASVVSLRELLGLIGAHEWRKKGVEIPFLKARIHPHYGVFSPVRGEYIDLLAKAPLPANKALAFDIGTGTGVIAAVLARRGVSRVVGTDQDPRALACARENIDRLGLSAKVDIVQADMFPEDRAPLIVCNPPWVPARPSSPIEHAVYDPDSRMLKGFLNGLAAHLEPGGEGWLIMSDLAEHLGLRSRAELQAAIDGAGLTIIARLDVKPHHPKATDDNDPLHVARQAELTSLWRLGVRA
ncbi:class I SAM-dependent methyltransferase [Aquabacterium sp.]|uniref:class I SAM-dependent methyltransferase n=1 Tax=Aquabacterium sp. TaxID=1872578 RepID=UPI0024896812|nr:class I SAM-dependent methyltransferase [Aquabacterium sp.]MDI1258193.1 class I SAM-dependent methyltransferase [Aquabacterium sp.]